MKKSFAFTFFSFIYLFCATPVWSQSVSSYPERTVRVIIPFPPGGTLDKVGRMLALRLSDQLGQTFIIENKPGGNGTIGADTVAKSVADGYTLLFNASTFISAPLTMKSVPYKVQTDFAPISLIAIAPLSIAISNKVGVTDLKTLIASAKNHSQQLNFAVGSIGSAGHLCTVRLEQAAGINLTVIPYKGTAPAFQDLIGGQIQGFIDPVLGSIQFHKNGQLKVVAVTSNNRLSNLPDVPTASETLSGFECASWYGLWAPGKVAPALIQKLNIAVNKELAGPMREQLLSDGLVPGGGSVAEFTKFQDNDIALSAKIISENKITLD